MIILLHYKGRSHPLVKWRRHTKKWSLVVGPYHCPAKKLEKLDHEMSSFLIYVVDDPKTE